MHGFVAVGLNPTAISSARILGRSIGLSNPLLGGFFEHRQVDSQQLLPGALEAHFGTGPGPFGPGPFEGGLDGLDCLDGVDDVRGSVHGG